MSHREQRDGSRTLSLFCVPLAKAIQVGILVGGTCVEGRARVRTVPNRGCKLVPIICRSLKARQLLRVKMGSKQKDDLSCGSDSKVGKH